MIRRPVACAWMVVIFGNWILTDCALISRLSSSTMDVTRHRGRQHLAMAIGGDSLGYKRRERARSHTEAGLDEMIRALPEGVSTAVGRKFGRFTLSDGQWRRVAMRAHSRGRAEIVILDEPSSISTRRRTCVGNPFSRSGERANGNISRIDLDRPDRGSHRGDATRTHRRNRNARCIARKRRTLREPLFGASTGELGNGTRASEERVERSRRPRAQSWWPTSSSYPSRQNVPRLTDACWVIQYLPHVAEIVIKQRVARAQVFFEGRMPVHQHRGATRNRLDDRVARRNVPVFVEHQARSQ